MAARPLLIVDGVERDRAGLREFFEQRGYEVSAAATSDEARDLVARGTFPGALINIDLGGTGQGVALARYLKAHSPKTAVVMLCQQPTYDGMQESLRAGAIDVVRKTPEQLEYLAGVIGRAMRRAPEIERSSVLLHEARSVLDDAFKIMLEQARQVYPAASVAGPPPQILIVDADQDFLKEFVWLTEDLDWQVHGEANGGGALDRGMSGDLTIVASRDDLLDLRGSMVVRSIQSQSPDVLGLVYSEEGEGKLDSYEHGQITRTDSSFGGSEDLLKRIEQLLEQRESTAEDRRLIHAFSEDHRAFLGRYAALKLEIDRLIADRLISE